ncbi:flagellar biosynthetic protein FliO [Terasakiella sp. A23]|uniref:FliO/MopB family protein n=1 Tax=Terasakiella sp. FCG-A23 TaxID=3080561 RepID=UPI0029546473|nr:flagellar biosynthetic protein FliO [Terasakiella sp. A23]MDV7339082.1 flagellar biosynthetic protein FliO [Terasakiella sp. A23]
MEITDYLRFVFALAFVVALIGILAMLAKRYGMGYRNVARTTKRRLSISEIMPIDNKRRLVLIKRDDKEHLLVLGGTTDLVVEQNISDNDFSFSDHLEKIDDNTSSATEDKSS